MISVEDSMARLNDPPIPPTESIDALKRRFIRQNREIARVNSNQSQRIRNLESEISRLLSENIALREQAIAALTEAERWRATSRLANDVLELRSRLQSKLSEVNALVEDLGGLPDKAARRSSVRRRKSVKGPEVTGSPNERDWRNRQTIGGVIMGEREDQDGRLPAILEDKCYPRRTLETEELRILTAAAMIGNDDTESPDIGPPPVAHFEVAESVAFDSSKSPKRVSGGIVNDETELVPLPKNLEARRKRRNSSLLRDISSLQDEVEEHHQEANVNPAPTLKSNVKRKFEVSEIEVETIQAPRLDDFEYSRRTNTTRLSKPSRFTPRPIDLSEQTHAEQQPTSPQKELQPRRALAPKSTNSPAKKIAASTNEQRSVLKADDEIHVKPSSRPRIPNATRPGSHSTGRETVVPLHVPTSPVPLLDGIVSPPPSAVDVEFKSKSTEAAITNSVEDVLNGSIGRGSRRARAAVSYAEPSLRDKMRRPDKKLVGAVEGLSKSTTSSDQESGRGKSSEPMSQSSNGIRVIKIKSEKKSDNEAWKDLPEADAREMEDEAASPLKNKERPAITSTRLSETRRKRTYSESEGTKVKQIHTKTEPSKEPDLGEAVSRLSIYDPPNSSPTSIRTTETMGGKRLPQSDRPTSTASLYTAPTLPTTTTTTTKSRRNSTQTNTSILSQSIPPLMPGKENSTPDLALTSKLKRSSSVQTLPQSHLQSHSSIQTQNQTQTGSRSQRLTVEKTLGARRRSMMV